MPGMDKTGPLGTCPIGIGMGPCGAGTAGWGRGRVFRRGGWSAWLAPMNQPAPQQEKEVLEQQKDWLERQLTAISQQLENLQK